MQFLILCLALVAVNVDQRISSYHDQVGIPLVRHIREVEEAAVLSGSRIIGGQPAPLGAHPYLVGVLIHIGTALSACGSSMLSNTRAVTAAHCWIDSIRVADRFTMIFGSEYLFSGGVRVDTDDVQVHSGWNPDSLLTLEYDLAIVTFDHVEYTDVIKPISLPTGALESNDFARVWAQASGYGLIGHGIPIASNQVQSHVTLQVLSNSACAGFFGNYVTERIICTSGVGPVGICSSDSGGPLSIVEDDERVLIGVISFNSGLCEGGSPSGYVRVTAHLPWIQERL